MSIQINAHAKLNLALDIRGTLPNGYHLIDTIFQEVTLADVIEIDPARTIEIECNGVEPQDNTVMTAARAFFEKVGIRAGVSVRIQKNIPMGAGLGGGSSDAAAVLRGLNELYDSPMSKAELIGIARSIGADTPFFMVGGTQSARGVGDKFHSIENLCGFKYLLVMPEERVATAEAYRVSDTLPRVKVDVERAAAALEKGDRTEYFDYAGNGLMPAAEKLVPEITRIGKACMDAGAEYWLMTGSGSCVFSIFGDNCNRERAQRKLSKQYPFVMSVDDYTPRMLQNAHC